MQFRAKKSLGQNFLKNPRIAETIAKSAGIEPGDFVLEIGPGTGMLTNALLKEGATVIALEADPRAVIVLSERFEREISDGHLILYHGDARETQLSSLIPQGKPFKIAANIPYYLSGYLFEKVLSGERQPKTLVFLVQKEVAERIARSKKESLLSLSIKAYGKPSYIATVARGNFSPSPNVDSAILRVIEISKARFGKESEEALFALLKLGFGSRRKQLLGNLSASYPRDSMREIFTKLGISEKVRAEDISIEIWLKLLNEITTNLPPKNT